MRQRVEAADWRSVLLIRALLGMMTFFPLVGGLAAQGLLGQNRLAGLPGTHMYTAIAVGSRPA